MKFSSKIFKKIKSIFVMILLLVFCFNLVACTSNIVGNKSSNIDTLPTIDLILDWTPNTNHTGLFVAKEKGYDVENGFVLDIKRPPEDSTTAMVANGAAAFGISFQDSLAYKFAKNVNVTAVAAILENNTSGLVSSATSHILSAKDLENKRYGTWNDEIELKMIEYLMKIQGGDFKKLQLVPNNSDNSIVAISNNLFDCAWVYYAWDVIMAKDKHIDVNFFYLKDIAPEFNYYSPVIIANNEYLKDKPQEAKKVLQSIKKGYQYAAEHPKEAAEILMKYAPELKKNESFTLASQEFISKEYAGSLENWGHIDPQRWNKFYKWLYDNNLIDKDLSKEKLFDNQYID